MCLSHFSHLITPPHSQGVGEIIRSDDTIFGEGGGDIVQVDAEGEETFATINVNEARLLNRMAGESGHTWADCLSLWLLSAGGWVRRVQCTRQ